MRRLAALLFDLDGTLADTSAANYAAYARALGEVGITVDRAQFDALAFGRNWRQFLPDIMARAGTAADPATVARRKQELYPGLVGTVRLNEPLLALARTGRETLRTALVTTASSANVRTFLDHHAFGDLFDVTVTGDDVAQHKPHPAAYLAAVSLLRVAPDECLAFEDSEIGVASASAAGVPVVRIAW